MRSDHMWLRLCPPRCVARPTLADHPPPAPLRRCSERTESKSAHDDDVGRQYWGSVCGEGVVHNQHNPSPLSPSSSALVTPARWNCRGDRQVRGFLQNVRRILQAGAYRFELVWIYPDIDALSY